MSLFSEYVEREQVGAQITDTIHMRPIAVRENGSLVAMVQEFSGGDASFPNVVSRAPLRIRTANDGMRRFLPVAGRDDLYFEMGAPFVKVGGVWTQVSLGTPSRSGNVLTWTRPQSITRFVHGGHFGDLTIELRNGFVPEDSQIAFPVGLNGLTRSGVNIQHNGETVARLRPFVMVDADNPFDQRAITHTFPLLNGQRYLLLTLPNLAGMTRPVIDPALELQPDAQVGKETFLYSAGAASNFGTNNTWCSCVDGGSANRRELIQFDVSSISPTATVSLAELAVKCNSTLGAGEVSLYRVTQAWTEDGATWLTYNGSNNWASAGGDFHATVYGTVNPGGGYTNGDTYTFAPTTLVQAWVDGTFSNLGFLAKRTTESGQGGLFGHSDDATNATDRPKLTVTYTVAAAARMFMFYQRLRQ